MYKTTALSILLATIVSAGDYSSSETQVGTITTYYGPKYGHLPDSGGDQVACPGIKPDWHNDPYMAAIPVSKYENGKHCNKKMRICNANNRSKCVTVRIVDSCAGDACKEFDLSSTAAEELGGDNIKVVYGPADGSLSEETETVSKVPKHNVSASETKVSAETVTPTASATTTTPCPEETRSTQASTEASTTPCPDEHVSETSTTPCPEETTATEEGKSTSTTTPCPEEDSYQNDKETEKGEEKEKSTSEVIGDQFGGYVSASSTIGYSIVALLSMFVLNVYQ